MNSKKNNLSEDKRVAIDGDNSGLVNTGTINNLTINQITAAEVASLSSFLSDIVIELSELASSAPLIIQSKNIPPAVDVKLIHNKIKRNMRLVDDWRNYGYLLAAALSQAERQNPNASYFLHRNIGIQYRKIRDELLAASKLQCGINEFVQMHCDEIIDQLIAALENTLTHQTTKGIKHEISQFAIGVVVADSIIDCTVLEKPTNVIA